MLNNNLTFEQIRFLEKHEVALSKVFNAIGYKASEYKIIMKDLDMEVAYNVTPCRNYGHMLRNRSGHCIQCNTAYLAFQKRHDSAGIVYIAGSQLGQVIKVGFTKAVQVRSESLNRTKYAGFQDWKILFGVKSDLAGNIETAANSYLNKHIYKFDYEHDGHEQESHETFLCSLSKSKSIIEYIIKNNSYDSEILLNLKVESYEFPNLIRNS